MTTSLAYDDSATLTEMHDDCRATRAALAPLQAPSLRFEDQPRERPKREIEISEATAALAAAIYGTGQLDGI